MKNNMNKVITMIALLMLTSISAWAEQQVSIVKKPTDAAGTVTAAVANGVCTLTVTPAEGYYLAKENLTAVTTLDGSAVQVARRAGGITISEGTQLTISGDGIAAAGAPATFTFTMPEDQNFNVEVTAEFQERLAAGLAWDKESVETTFDAAETMVRPVLTNPNELSVSYTSSDESVATIDAQGAVTVVGMGATTITASSEATDVYTAGEASYTLRVYKLLSDESITVTIAEATYDGTAQTPVVTVKDGTTTISSGLYEVNYANNLNAALSTATQHAPTVTVAALTNLDTENYYRGEVTKTFTIGQKTLTEAMVKLSDESFEYNGETQKPEVTVSDKMTIKDVETEIITANDYTITNEGGSAVGTYTVTVTGKGNYTGEVTKTFEISRRTVIVAELGVSGEGNYGSYYHATEDLSLPEGYSAYIVSGIASAAATLTAISYIPKATPVIVSQSDDSDQAEGAATGGNMMLHADGDVTTTSISGTVYGLYNNVLMRVTGTIPAGKNYLVVAGAAGAPKLTFVVDKGQGEGSATAIRTIETSETAHDAWYTLDGRRLQQKPSQKGLYIRNGQKVVVNK